MTREQRIDVAVRFVIGQIGLKTMQYRLAHGCVFEEAAWMSPSCVELIRETFYYLPTEMG